MIHARIRHDCEDTLPLAAEMFVVVLVAEVLVAVVAVHNRVV